MGHVHRRDFLPEEAKWAELEDRPLPIGFGQTTSQPSLIALMIETLQLKPDSKVLEVGTGSGYQTALLAQLCAQVYSIDIVEPLARAARLKLIELGYRNTFVKAGDGSLGWPEHAPFDGIIVCAATAAVPEALLSQLARGGRMVIPIGKSDDAHLVVYEKDEEGVVHQQTGLAVRFVPLVHDFQNE